MGWQSQLAFGPGSFPPWTLQLDWFVSGWTVLAPLGSPLLCTPSLVSPLKMWALLTPQLPKGLWADGTGGPLVVQRRPVQAWVRLPPRFLSCLWPPGPGGGTVRPPLFQAPGRWSQLWSLYLLLVGGPSVGRSLGPGRRVGG